MPWRILDHTADVRLEVEAAGWLELLEEAAAAFGGLVGDAQAGGAQPRAAAVPTGEPLEAWVQWWRTLLRLWTVEGLLAVGAELRRPDPRILAVPAAALDLARFLDVKAVTWHAASAQEAAPGHWRGSIVLDV